MSKYKFELLRGDFDILYFNHRGPFFQGLLTVLEYCLSRSMAGYAFFEHFIDALGYCAVQFWRYAVPYIYDSDLSYGTKFRDLLLFSLTLYDINNGKSKLRFVKLRSFGRLRSEV